MQVLLMTRNVLVRKPRYFRSNSAGFIVLGSRGAGYALSPFNEERKASRNSEQLGVSAIVRHGVAQDELKPSTKPIYSLGTQSLHFCINKGNEPPSVEALLFLEAQGQRIHPCRNPGCIRAAKSALLLIAALLLTSVQLHKSLAKDTSIFVAEPSSCPRTVDSLGGYLIPSARKSCREFLRRD